MIPRPVEKELDITPFTEYLHAAHNKRLGWKTCLCELVDNSLDASANSIKIEFGSKLLRISDDGKGIAKLESAFRLGHHEDHPATALGMYGVGLKDAALWLWGETTVANMMHGAGRQNSTGSG